jgi:tetratricopeptide (TPR) repeat protein
MATDEKLPRGSYRLETLRSVLADKLEHEPQILDVLVAATAKGQGDPALFELLHAAAQRDERIAELAFAYERLGQDRRMKTVPAAAQSEIFFHAARFFGDVFGDTDGAVTYLERVLALAPGHEGAFARLENILSAKDDRLRLRDLYASAAAHRSDVGEQVRLLRCALVLTGESDAERTIVLLEQIYKTDPTAEGIRDTLAQRLALAGRHGEAAKLIEQTLAAAAGEPPEATSRMRRRLVDLYAAKMHEAERAISHVEELLRADPEDALAKKCAEELLSHKVLGVRAAGALEGVYLHEARWIDAAGMMKLQAEQQRGPKRLEAQKRLAALTFERLGDLAKALSLYEAIVLADPADDDARDHFRKLSAALDKFGDAARILARVATAVREPKVKGRILAELGDVYAAQGDDKRARSTLFAALETGEDGDAMLGAAITLTNLLSVARDFRGLVVVLARLAELEPSATARLAAAERLAKVWEADLGDPKAAALAWRKLLGTKREATALAALERLYELTEDHPALAEILEKRAENEKSPAERRRLLLAAADRRALSPEGRGAALAAYANLATAYGASRELVERALPLLEQERRYAEVGVALEELARLVPTAEKAGVFARLAQVELARLRQPERAFAAYKQALALDPTERASRLAIEKLLASPSPPVAVAQRLAAADVLEPLYRKEAANAALARLLEVRGEIAEPVAARLAALAEATTLSANAGDGKRALELAGKGLRGAATQRVEDVRAWIARVDALSQVDAAKRGASLAAALEGVTVTRPELFELAKRAGETLAEAGDVGRALGAFRLALAFDPASPELVARVDGLLREQGSPAERVALFRAALDEPAGRGPRAALHRSIATIEHRELGDLGAAITSYRAALAEEPGDRASFEGLCEAHEARGAWSELYDELGRGLERAGGDERPPLVLRLAELAVLCGSPEQASGHYRELLRGETPVAEPVLAAIEKLATTYGDTDLLEQVIERRIALAIEPLEEIAWLERLGTLKLELRKRPKEAGRAWKRAAALAEGASTEPERAARLYEKVLTTTPEDPEAATRLAELYRAANAWERLPRVYELVLAGPLPAEERARWVLAWGEVAARTGGLDAFVDATDRALAEEPSAPLRRRLLVGRARALATLPTRRAEAASTYRGLLETGDAEAEAIARSFEELLAKHEGRDLDADRRWLFAYRVERASETEKPRLLHTWAEAEAGPMGDPTAAAELYARALDADPEDERALLALVRLRLAQGDGEGAALAIQSRRSGRDGVRGALDAELGALLVAAGRPSDALDAVRPALESAPVAEAVLAVLASIIAHPGSTAELLGALETLAARAPALEARRAVFDGLLGTRPEGSTKERRAGWYAGLFDACREEPEAALAVVLRAVAETPSDLGLWDRAEAIAAELHRPEAVSAAYRDVVREGGADLPLEILATLGRRAVEHLEEWFDDEDAVRSILRRVATGLGDVGWAFERLKLEYASREEYGALLDLYDAVLARQTDPDVALALVEEAAFAARDFAADPARAIGYFEALLPHPTRRAAALPALERLYERTGEHKKLALLFAEELRRLEGTRGAAPEDAARLRVRMATLWLDGADAKMALEVLAPLFGAEGASPAALAVAERVLDSGAEAVHRRTAAALLEACYRTTGRSRDLVRVLEATAGLIADPTEKDRLLREVLALRLGPLQDAAGGLETLATLLLLDPSDAHIRAELTALAERLGRAGRLVDALVAAAERATARATAEGLLDEAALLCEARLGDLDRLEGWRAESSRWRAPRRRSPSERASRRAPPQSAKPPCSRAWRACSAHSTQTLRSRGSPVPSTSTQPATWPSEASTPWRRRRARAANTSSSRARCTPWRAR